MFTTAARIIVQKVISDKKLVFPPIKDTSSLKNSLIMLVCGYITACVYTDYNKYYNTKSEINSNSREQHYINNVINSNNFSEKLFTNYPVLKTLINNIICNYVQYANLIYKSFMDDYEQLTSIWKCDIGQIEEIKIGKGDTHSGVSVAIIKTENIQLVYKPHSLSADVFFYRILTDICNRISVNIYVPKMLSADSHSWQEYIPYTECANNDEAAQFFYKAGIIQFVFYMFLSVDMHYENLICFGKDPIFIDLETLISGSVSTLEFCEPRSLNSSVLMTGMLPGLKGAKNLIDVNLSALFTEKAASKKHFITTYAKDSEGLWKEDTIPVMTTPSHNIVKINGHVVQPHTFEKEYIQGFVNASSAFQKHREHYNILFDELETNSIRMRKILRPTMVYGRFIEASIQPEALRSEQEYNKIFNILRENFTIGAFGYLRVNYEIDELKKGNIPLFDIYSDKTNLYADGTLLCENYMCETPYSLVKKHCATIDEEMINYQVRLIKMSLVSQDKPRDLVYSIKTNAQNSDQLLYVKECADMISKSLISAPGNGKAMIMLHTDAEDKSFIIHTGDSELYHFGGLIWFLYAYGIKHDRQSCEYALGLVSLLYSKYEYDSDSAEEKNYSVYSGYGALSYIMYNIYKHSGNVNYLNQSIRIIEDGLKNICTRDINYDYISGDLSLIYLSSLIVADSLEGKEKLISLIAEIKDRIINENFVFSDKGLAHGSAGLLLTISALDAIVDGCKKKKDSLVEAIKKEKECCSSKAWCRGTTGYNMALYKAGSLEGNTSIELSNTKENTNLCLCHGLFGEIDMFLTLFPERNGDIKDFVNMYDFKTLQVFRDSDYIYESFMLGVTGIAYTLLRIEDPDLPSLLLLDLYRG